MKKYFMMLAFMCTLIFTTSVFASNWVSIYKDNLGNEWHIEADTVKVDKNSNGVVEFHANFSKVFSEQGLKAEAENFAKSGEEKFPENVAFEMQCIHFKEEGGKIYLSVTDSFYFDSNGKPIPEFNYVDKAIEWHTIKQDSVVYELYKSAKKYI